MTTISSAGIGSGLDVNSLVTQLVAAERQAPDQRLMRTDAKLTAEFTALASLKGALGGLQSAANNLKGPGTFDLRKATVADEAYFTASAGPTAVAGSYSIEVQSLAAAAQLGSRAYAGADAVVGTGTLTISSGGQSFEVAVTSSNNTLAGIRDAINAAAGSVGVRATLINGVDGSGNPEAHLVLTGSKTGIANAVTVAVADDDAGDPDDGIGLSELATAKLSVLSEARDARVKVSGYTITSATNTISNAIDGVTLTLKKVTAPGDGVTPAQTVALGVARDDAAIQKKAEGLVNAFNYLAAQVKSLGGYDAATRTGGPLLGDSMLRGIDSQIRRIIGDPVAGAAGSYNSLAALGITTRLDGMLELDAGKFKAALEADPQAVNRVFSEENGVAARLGSYLDGRLSSAGELAARDASISAQRKNLDQQREALEARITLIQERYLKQFSALDAMLGQLQSTSSYLTTQLSSLSRIGDE